MFVCIFILGEKLSIIHKEVNQYLQNLKPNANSPA